MNKGGKGPPSTAGETLIRLEGLLGKSSDTVFYRLRFETAFWNLRNIELYNLEVNTSFSKVDTSFSKPSDASPSLTILLI